MNTKAPGDIGGNRRPIQSRSAGWAQRFAAWLARLGISPNMISLCSLVAAIFGAATLVYFGLAAAGGETGFAVLALVATFVAVQVRLLCNLFDGMVAVEGGLGGPDGEMFNDLPDRPADVCFLVAMGYAAAMQTWIDWPAWWPTLIQALGWSAGLLAVGTAYVRVFSVSLVGRADFSGPMAKQHRMAVVNVALITSIIEQFFWSTGIVFVLALMLIFLGACLTVGRRLVRLRRHLFDQSQGSS